MRTLIRSLKLGALATIAGGAALAAQDGEASDARTTAHAVYTDEQATRGEDVFFNICAECHFEDDFGGPFMQSWSGASVKALLEEIQATMPEDNPGGLPASQYIDVISFMFKLSGMPVGDAEMAEADLDDIDIDWRPSYDEVADAAVVDPDAADPVDDSVDPAADSVDPSADSVDPSDAEGVDASAPDDASAEARTTAHGVYDDEQAVRGEDLFWNICSECHVEDDFGGPFMQSWNGASVKDLLEEIQATMPEDNPGGMPASQYIDIISYMFRLSGMPAGDAEMIEADLDAIDIDWRSSYDDAATDTEDTAAAASDTAAAATDTARVRSRTRR